MVSDTTSASTPTADAKLARRPVFFLVGDSLTQDGGVVSNDGWSALLQEEYLRSVDVINRGLCGYSTQYVVDLALPVLCEEIEHTFRPTFITVWLGANDAALENGPEGFLHVPVDQYRENLVRIVQDFRTRAPQAKILLITPATVDNERRRQLQVEAGGRSDPLDRTNEQAAIYASACGEAAAAFNDVSVLDLHAFLTEKYPDPAVRETLFHDGLHFSKDGNRVVFEQVHKHIKDLLPAASVDTWQFPDFREVAQRY